MEELFTPEEVAEKLKVTKSAVYKWMKQGKLDFVFVGSDRRITPKALQAFVEESTRQGRMKESEEKNATPGLVGIAA